MKYHRYFSNREKTGALRTVLGFAVVFAFFGTTPVFSADSAATWNVREHIPQEKITVQAHRGAGELAPENSLEAFEIAWNLKVVPEADLRTTKDGIIVSFHDNNFTRILPHESAEMKKKGIIDLAYEEVKKLDIGAWKGEDHKGQKIASLEEIVEVLKKHPQRRVYIDIKNVDFEQLAKETRDVHPQLILASTKYEEIKRWKQLAPKSFTLHWMGGTREKLAERLDALEKEKFDSIDQLQIHVNLDQEGKFSPDDSFLKESGDRLRKYGILFQTLPWGGKDPEVYKRLMDLGCASFATDYPDITMKAIREYYESEP